MLNTREEISEQNITLAIQAGGFSKRMGQDKGLLPLNGLPLIEYIARRGTDAVIPRSRGGLEPLYGVYRQKSCLDTMHEALEMKFHALIGWLKLRQGLEITEDQIRPFDPEMRAFTNLNTPEEYHQAEALASTDQRGKGSIRL